MKQLFTAEFIKFVLVGGGAAAVNFASRILYSQVMDFRWAVLVAYLTGMITAFLLSKIYVFEESGKHTAHEFLHFSLVNLAAVIQVWVISVGLAEYVFPQIGVVSYREEIAHFIGLAIPVFTSYYGHKYFSFAKKTTSQE